MANYQKTYGIVGQTEVHLLIPVGKAHMAIDFTGGNLGGSGTAPAEFKTKDEITQAVIENSAYFKRGYIRLVRKTPLADNGQPAKPAEIPTLDITPQQQENNPTVNPTAPSDSQLTEVSVTCRTDAKDYLEKNFGIKRSEMTSKAKIEALAQKYGIFFNGSLD